MDQARALVADMAIARERWLGETAAGMRASGLWLVGSQGRGGGDAWSDLDLIVVDGTPGTLSLFDALDVVGRNKGTAPDPDTFALAMLPLAAKQVIRGNLDGANRMADLLAAPAAPPPLERLAAVFARTDGDPVARGLVGRVLEVVAALQGN